MGDTRDPNADSLFAPLRSRPGYAAARNRLLANRLPILDGTVAFELDDPDFIPEAIALRQRSASIPRWQSVEATDLSRDA